MNHEDKSKNNVQPKKVYKSPCIFHYGTIEKMTKTVGQTGSADGGGPKANNKTR